MKKVFAVIWLVCGFAAFGAEVIPPAPKLYFNDYANVVSETTSRSLNESLADFERETSSQILVTVFPKMQSDSSIEDYTVRVAQSWKVGQKEKNNGAVLFVFTQDRKMYLQVGYGLEGVLPDALCKRIIEDEIKPHFKAGDFNAGLTAGVNAILAAAKGEYKGTGRTVAQSRKVIVSSPITGFILFIVLIIIICRLLFRASGGFFSSGGWSSGGWSSGGGGFSGGGGWSSGGGSSGFSGGGGSFGGGGAGGSW